MAKGYNTLGKTTTIGLTYNFQHESSTMSITYKKRMQRKKEYIDSRIDEANIDKGIIVLLTGNGKGKSSSAMGMICRALGYDMKVALVRFLKGDQQTGEDLFIENHPNIISAHMESGFTWDTQDKELDKQKATCLLYTSPSPRDQA